MLGALIGAGASIAGNLLGANSQKKANEANERQNERNIALQKEFAQSGIQWKVQDAEKAGVHPLFALGAQTTSFSPSSIGTQATDYSALGEAGQNIGRAIDATRSSPASAMALQLGKIQLEGAQLDNEFKKVQLASALATNQPPHPAMPTMTTEYMLPGQGNTATIDGPSLEIQKKISPVAPGSPNIEVGGNPEVVLYKTKTGYAPQIPQGLSESFEQDNIGYWQWAARNRLFGDQNAIRAMPTRPGFRKHYSPWAGEYYYSRYPTYKDKRFKNLKGYPR